MRAELWRGAELFNQGAWWEAHEAWEEVWHQAHGQEKQFIQGLILLAAALHKRWHHGSLSGRNYHKAQAKLAELPGEYGGVNLLTLQRDVLHALEHPDVRPQLPLP